MTTISVTLASQLMDPCRFHSFDYTIVSTSICSLLVLLGFIYSFFGYKYRRVTTFLSGAFVGSTLAWVICKSADSSSRILSSGATIGITCAAGIMSAIITTLVETVGLFITGFVFGGLLGISTLVSVYYLSDPLSRWAALAVVGFLGLLVSLFALRWKKVMTVLSTAAIGAFLMTIALDYFVEEYRAIRVIAAVFYKLEEDERPYLCWISWLLLGFWPFSMLIGLLIQWKITSKKNRKYRKSERLSDRMIVKAAMIYRPTKSGRRTIGIPVTYCRT